MIVKASERDRGSHESVNNRNSDESGFSERARTEDSTRDQIRASTGPIGLLSEV